MEIVGDQTNINGAIIVSEITSICEYLDYSKEDTLNTIRKAKYIEGLYREYREEEKKKAKALKPKK